MLLKELDKTMSSKLLEVYNILLKNYSPQNWWPVTDKGELIPTYKKREFLTEKQILEICIVAILTQNTNWEPNVTTSITNLNKKNLINLEKLKRIDDKKLAILIKSSGYYNQKTKNIKLFVAFLHEFPIKKLKELDTEKLREILLKQKGIGNETADSIVLYAFNKPSFVIDAYTRRILERLSLIQENSSYEQIQELFHTHLEKNPSLFSEYHALLVEHAKRFCKSNPECENCPIRPHCQHKV